MGEGVEEVERKLETKEGWERNGLSIQCIG